MNDRAFELLYRSFDGALTPGEESELREALAASADLRMEEKQLRAMRAAVASGAVRAFKPFFPARVMSRLQAQVDPVEEFVRGLMAAFKPVAGVAAVALICILVISIATRGSISLDTILGVPEPTLEETWQLSLEVSNQ